MRIQPIVRGWFGRQFVAWKRANDNLGTTMNKVVRGYLARCQFKRMLAAHFHKTVVIPSIIVMQCMVRSSFARIEMKRLKHEKWIREVAIPASILIEKRVRGMIIRERFRIQKLRMKSSILIQTAWRGKSDRIEFVQIQIRGKIIQNAKWKRERCIAYMESTVVFQFLFLLLSFKLVSLSLSRIFFILKHPKQVIF